MAGTQTSSNANQPENNSENNPENKLNTDPYDLNRFLGAQKNDYQQALSEVKRGHKQTHWMWYIFPQFEGIGYSPTSKHYSIKSLAEAKAYLNHPVLGSRLVEGMEAALRIEGKTAHEIFGSPDDKKLRSCATLFASISPAGSVFHQLLDKYFHGKPDGKTLHLLKTASPKEQDPDRGS